MEDINTVHAVLHLALTILVLVCLFFGIRTMIRCKCNKKAKKE